MPEETTEITEEATTEETTSTETTETAAEVTKSNGKDGESTTVDDWHARIPEGKVRDHAGRFTTPEKMAENSLALRKELSTAIQPLGQKPTDDQVTAYRKSMGVPKTAEEYKFPDLPEGEILTDVMKESRATWAGRFHKWNIPADTAAQLIAAVSEDGAAALIAKIADDKANADKSEAELKRDWPGDELEINKQFGNRALMHLFPEDVLAEVRNMEDKNGRFILDNPHFVRVFAQLGREMESRGPLVPMSEGERVTANETATGLRKKAQEAHARGDFGEADKLSEQERQLYEHRDGNQPIVGIEGRVT